MKRKRVSKSEMGNEKLKRTVKVNFAKVSMIFAHTHSANFPKLVFGHLHLSIYKLAYQLGYDLDCILRVPAT